VRLSATLLVRLAQNEFELSVIEREIGSLNPVPFEAMWRRRLRVKLSIAA
jgi:hypothetical protein